MGTSLTSIHIFGNQAPKNCKYSFLSFSENWLTCIDDFSDAEPDNSCKAAKEISRLTEDIVLLFDVFDSEQIWFRFFQDGKVIAKYSDDDLSANKKLYDVPAIVGYAEGNKKRLSQILACSDTELKIDMLEEFFGVCLLFHPDFLEEPTALRRSKSDKLYHIYETEEKALTGKSAPIKLQLITEYPGKLFMNVFGCHQTMKPHFYLYGYTSFDPQLTPVHFTGNSLETSDFETFEKDHIPHVYHDPRFEIQYGTPCKVTFSRECPAEYIGKVMTLPRGFYPTEFLPSGELLLAGNGRLFIADSTGKVIAKLPIKGNVADVVDRYILTTSGDSFFAYCYQPKAKIFIYEVVKNNP